MPFQSGKSGNPGGKPKGVQHADTIRLRSIVGQLLEDNYAQIIEDMKKLKPRERVQAWTSLLEYSLPKLQRSEMNLNIDQLSDEQIDALFQRALGVAESDDYFEGENENSIAFQYENENEDE